MKTYFSIFDFQPLKKSIVTIGTFDGVHLGHQSILNKLKSGKENDLYESVLLTFYPHPRMVLKQDRELKLLNSIEEKIQLLNQFGIDNLIIHPFDESFSKLSAEEFVSSILVDKLNIQKIIIGYDHRFGRNRTANIDDLIAFGEKYHFEVEQISAEEIDDISISSTKIRNAITEGNILLAKKYLGYDYFFSGTIIEGKKIGRTIGFPTANIALSENYKLIPKNGVYVVSGLIEERLLYGMMNIGNNPTTGNNEQTIEVHFFNVDEDLYEKNVVISILDYIRSEEKFHSLDDLKLQLVKDQEYSLEFIKKYEKNSL